MNTTINNKGAFTTRKRTYTISVGTLVCTIQHSTFYSKTFWTFTPTNSPVGFGNLKKSSLLRYLVAHKEN
jgi:hypothetical protein